MKHTTSVARLATARKSVRLRRSSRSRGVARGPRENVSTGALAQVAPTQQKLGLRALIATTFFVVSGGPYGLEEVISGHGFGRALILLAVVPLIWSLPITLLVGELTAMLPTEGGYYSWARRALGPFWGVQTAWMALAMSLFDMAIYPMLVVTYLGQLFPSLMGMDVGGAGWWAALVLIGLSVMWNLRGAEMLGTISQLIGVLLLLPFVVLVVLAVSGLGPTNLLDGISSHIHFRAHDGDNMMLWLNGLLLCLWNYMGWENASPVASCVENPQRTYPRAMFLTVLLIAGCYLLPVLCAVTSGMRAEEWQTGGWVEVGRRMGGPYLAIAIALGGALCGLGMFNALIATYSRLPLAMAEDGLLPKWLGKKDAKTGAPRRSILFSALLYTACLGLGFKRLIQIDVMLYGALMVIEFASLIMLRIKEPHLARPFRIPGGLPAVIGLGLLPTLLLAVSLWMGRNDPGMWGLSALSLGAIVLALGPFVYLASRCFARNSERDRLHPSPHGVPGTEPNPSLSATKTARAAYEFST